MRRTPAIQVQAPASPPHAVAHDAADPHGASLRRALATIEALCAKRRQSTLRRNDHVRDDQPDLSLVRRSGRDVGAHGAGRAGLPERRFPASLPSGLR